MIGPVVVPEGTAVVMLVLVLEDTIAVVPLNLTVLLVAVLLKLDPVMVTEVPTDPLVGLKLSMMGAVVTNIILRKIETVGFRLLDTAKSGFPSPSRSPMEAAYALLILLLLANK